MNNAPTLSDVGLPPRLGSLNRFRTIAGVIALAAGLLLGGGAIAQPDQAVFSSLVAFLFLLTVAVGALFWVMLHYLTAAVWSVVLRRLMEHLACLLLPSIALFVPMMLGIHLLYRWSDPATELDAVVSGKTAYLNVPFFFLRAAIYFAVWLGLMFSLRRQSLQQDWPDAERSFQPLGRWSAPGMLLLALTTTFAAFDWIMSLDPHWYSNLFGVYFWSGSILASLAAVTLFAIVARRYAGLESIITEEHLHDLGKLLFGFTVFWAYIAFSQYFLIWYAAIPEETVWYAARLQGNWGWVGGGLIIGHFIIPFLILLPRAPKRSPWFLSLVALWLLAFHGLDLYWQIMPTLHPDHATIHWLDFAAWVFVAAASLVTLAQMARMQSLIPRGDPNLATSIGFENE